MRTEESTQGSALHTQKDKDIQPENSPCSQLFQLLSEISYPNTTSLPSDIQHSSRLQTLEEEKKKVELKKLVVQVFITEETEDSIIQDAILKTLKKSYATFRKKKKPPSVQVDHPSKKEPSSIQVDISPETDQLRYFIYKELATWQVIINQVLEKKDLTTKQKERYLQQSKKLFRYYDYLRKIQQYRQGYYRFVQEIKYFFLYNETLSSLLDSERDIFALNLADYEFFDAFKKHIGLVKIIERFFGVQTVYFLETVYNSLEGGLCPPWLLFLQDSLFHWLNFALQTLDSFVFALGSFITDRDRGFRRWSKVAFASLFWLCALLPILALGINPISFKIAAILLGTLKSMLDLRHYLLKLERNRFRLQKITHLLEVYSETNQSSPNMVNKLLFQFALRKKLTELTEKVAESKRRIRDKQMALVITGITLAAMVTVACLPLLGHTLAISWIICTLFIIATGMKFFYRVCTYHSDRFNFGLLIHPETAESSIVDLDKLKEHEKPFAPQRCYQDYKKSLQPHPKTNIDKASRTQTYFQQLFTGNNSDFKDPQKALELIESAFQFDKDLFKDTKDLYDQLKSIREIKKNLDFYQRIENTAKADAYQKKLADLRQDIHSKKDLLQSGLEKISQVAYCLDRRYGELACSHFLMELFSQIDDTNSTVDKKEINNLNHEITAPPNMATSFQTSESSLSLFFTDKTIKQKSPSLKPRAIPPPSIQFFQLESPNENTSNKPATAIQSHQPQLPIPVA